MPKTKIELDIKPPKGTTPAFKAGWRAAAAGKKPKDNPYPVSYSWSIKAELAQWDSGFKAYKRKKSRMKTSRKKTAEQEAAMDREYAIIAELSEIL